MTKIKYELNGNGWVAAVFKDGGRIKVQSVTALLLYEILQELRKKPQNPAETHNETDKTAKT